MNFDVDYRYVHIVRSPQAVPLLVLVKEWGSYLKDAFGLTDTILLILKCIQPLAKFEHGLVVNDILDGLDSVELKSNFLKSFEDVLGNLTAFMNLFDQLNSLSNPSNKSTPPLLDVDCSNSIIGIYVRQCVLEFKKLTFSQLMRFHSSLQDYFHQQEDGTYIETPPESSSDVGGGEVKGRDCIAMVKHLLMCGGEGRHHSAVSHAPTAPPVTPPIGMELGSESLRLAELHSKFEHNNEGLCALEEAVRLAQQNENPLLLEHSLARLLKMESFEPKECLVMLEKFVKNVEELKLPTSGLWGRLQQARTQISISESPKVVLQNLLTCEVDYLSSYDNEEGNSKPSLHMCTLTLLATAWEHYGNRLQALHYAQLVCHMMSCDQHLPHIPEEQECVALAVAIIARQLHQSGEIEKSLSVLEFMMERFSTAGQPLRVLYKCKEELLFHQAIGKKDHSQAERHFTTTTTTTTTTQGDTEARYRLAVLTRCKGHLAETMDIVTDILKNKDKNSPPQVLSSCWQLLAEVNSDLWLAMTLAMEHLEFCRKHHLSCHRALLMLSKVLVQKGSLECLETLRQCSLQVLANGSLEERGVLYLLKARASLLQRKDKLTEESVDSVLSLVKQAVSDFEKMSAHTLMQEAINLQTWLYDHLGLQRPGKRPREMSEPLP